MEIFVSSLHCIKNTHPCIPVTLSLIAAASVTVAVKCISLTLTASSTANIVMSIASLYFCIGLSHATAKTWHNIDNHSSLPGRFGLVDDQVIKTVRALFHYTVFFPIIMALHVARGYCYICSCHSGGNTKL